MMRTNQQLDEPLKTPCAETWWSLGFRRGDDAAVAGEPVANGTWFWIDLVSALAFVGMTQHRGRATSERRTISRTLVYQALLQ